MTKIDLDTIQDNDARETAANILSLFEDLLDMHDLTIPSKDREIEDKVSEDEARIYGDVYTVLEDGVTQLIESTANFAGFMRKFGDKMPLKLKKQLEDWWLLEKI